MLEELGKMAFASNPSKVRQEVRRQQVYPVSYPTHATLGLLIQPRVICSWRAWLPSWPTKRWGSCGLHVRPGSITKLVQAMADLRSGPTAKHLYDLLPPDGFLAMEFEVPFTKPWEVVFILAVNP